MLYATESAFMTFASKYLSFNYGKLQLHRCAIIVWNLEEAKEDDDDEMKENLGATPPMVISP